MSHTSELSCVLLLLCFFGQLTKEGILPRRHITSVVTEDPAVTTYNRTTKTILLPELYNIIFVDSKTYLLKTIRL